VFPGARKPTLDDVDYWFEMISDQPRTREVVSYESEYVSRSKPRIGRARCGRSTSKSYFKLWFANSISRKRFENCLVISD